MNGRTCPLLIYPSTVNKLPIARPYLSSFLLFLFCTLATPPPSFDSLQAHRCLHRPSRSFVCSDLVPRTQPPFTFLPRPHLRPPTQPAKMRLMQLVPLAGLLASVDAGKLVDADADASTSWTTVVVPTSTTYCDVSGPHSLPSFLLQCLVCFADFRPRDPPPGSTQTPPTP